MSLIGTIMSTKQMVENNKLFNEAHIKAILILLLCMKMKSTSSIHICLGYNAIAYQNVTKYNIK